MKYIALTVVLAILMGLLIINTAYGKGRCKEITRRVVRQASYGYRTRVGHGEFNGRPHRWVEYFCRQHQKWEVWDDAIWYIKKTHYTAEELGYKVRRYEE